MYLTIPRFFQLTSELQGEKCQNCEIKGHTYLLFFIVNCTEKRELLNIHITIENLKNFVSRLPQYISTILSMQKHWNTSWYTHKALPEVCPLGRWASGWTLARVFSWLVFLSKQKSRRDDTKSKLAAAQTQTEKINWCFHRDRFLKNTSNLLPQ